MNECMSGFTARLEPLCCSEVAINLHIHIVISIMYAMSCNFSSVWLNSSVVLIYLLLPPSPIKSRILNEKMSKWISALAKPVSPWQLCDLTGNQCALPYPSILYLHSPKSPTDRVLSVKYWMRFMTGMDCNASANFKVPAWPDAGESSLASF